VDAMLMRLKVEAIDLLCQHRASIATCRSRMSRGPERPDRVGKVKHFGLSEAAPETIRRARGPAGRRRQSECSLWTRDVEQTACCDLRGTRDRLRALGAAGAGS
jgi:aryl-alcohol dehydrogenase-like predicted oxidoreductase